MTNLPVTTPKSTSYRGAIAHVEQSTWERLDGITVAEAISYWLETLENKNTQKNYRSGADQLFQRNLLDPMETLQTFALRPHAPVLDRIKVISGWREATRQARAALYCAFTRFLSRQTDGMIRKATPSREGTTKTFFKIRETVSTRPLKRQQWEKFLKELEKINHRDALIAKLMLQGGKRKSEVLSLQTDQINWENHTITFHQVKTRGMVKETVITYPPHIFQFLRDYLDDRTGHVFITKNGNAVHASQIDRNFIKAGKKAEIPFKVTPHVLRTSTVTYLKEQNFEDSDIMRVTGHSSAEMIAMYDRRAKEDNASRKVNLV